MLSNFLLEHVVLGALTIFWLPFTPAIPPDSHRTMFWLRLRGSGCAPSIRMATASWFSSRRNDPTSWSSTSLAVA
jgi:hypothetical protein